HLHERLIPAESEPLHLDVLTIAVAAAAERANHPHADSSPRSSGAQCQNVQASSASPMAMRYHANFPNPERRTTFRKGRTTSADQTKAITKPTAISEARPAPRSWRASIRSCAKAATIAGIARKKENSAAAGRSTPASMPATIVPPDRETPGTRARV